MCKGRLGAHFQASAGSDPRQGLSAPWAPPGTPHLCATSTSLLRVFPTKGPFAGPGEALAVGSWKGWGKGQLASLFSNLEAGSVPPPPQKSRLFTCDFHSGFDSCHCPRSSKAKGPTASYGKVELGGGADSRGAAGRKQKASSAGTPPGAEGETPELRPRLPPGGGRKNEPGGRGGAGVCVFWFSVTILIWL